MLGFLLLQPLSAQYPALHELCSMGMLKSLVCWHPNCVAQSMRYILKVNNISAVFQCYGDTVYFWLEKSSLISRRVIQHPYNALRCTNAFAVTVFMLCVKKLILGLVKQPGYLQTVLNVCTTWVIWYHSSHGLILFVSTRAFEKPHRFLFEALELTDTHSSCNTFHRLLFSSSFNYFLPFRRVSLGEEKKKTHTQLSIIHDSFT